MQRAFAGACLGHSESGTVKLPLFVYFLPKENANLNEKLAEIVEKRTAYEATTGKSKTN
jgi:hypothetical protein